MDGTLLSGLRQWGWGWGWGGKSGLQQLLPGGSLGQGGVPRALCPAQCHVGAAGRQLEAPTCDGGGVGRLRHRCGCSSLARLGVVNVHWVMGVGDGEVSCDFRALGPSSQGSIFSQGSLDTWADGCELASSGCWAWVAQLLPWPLGRTPGDVPGESMLQRGMAGQPGHLSTHPAFGASGPAPGSQSSAVGSRLMGLTWAPTGTAEGWTGGGAAEHITRTCESIGKAPRAPGGELTSE